MQAGVPPTVKNRLAPVEMTICLVKKQKIPVFFNTGIYI